MNRQGDRESGAQGGLGSWPVWMAALVALGVLLATWIHQPGRVDDAAESVSTRLASIGLLGVPFPAGDPSPHVNRAASLLGGQAILWLAAMDMLPVAMAEISGNEDLELAAAHAREERATRAAGRHRYQVPY
jgi:hypothetical protein